GELLGVAYGPDVLVHVDRVDRVRRSGFVRELVRLTIQADARRIARGRAADARAAPGTATATIEVGGIAPRLAGRQLAEQRKLRRCHECRSRTANHVDTGTGW